MPSSSNPHAELSPATRLGLTSQIRRDIVRMVHGAKSGHPGGSLGCVEFFTALYFECMNYALPFSKETNGEDLFFLSNGHISPVWYSTLARAGFFEVAELTTFRKLNSRLQGHPTPHEHLPGIRVASGSLGQGISVAAGAALAKKRTNDSATVYALTGDGELQEGQIWEAALYCAHNQIDNLLVTVDYNGQQIDGPVSKVLGLQNLAAKWEAFGWHVLVTEDGNDLAAVTASLKKGKEALGQHKPVIHLMHTQMGAGIDFMMGSHKWHGIAPDDAQLEQALDLLITEGQYDY
jgi:transketolase